MESSHNGIAAVLKTAVRKDVGVRLPRSPQKLKISLNKGVRTTFSFKKRIYMKIEIILLLLLGLLISNFSYAQQKNLKLDMKYQILSNNFQVVSDSLDHKIGRAIGSGSAMLKDQATAEVKVFFIYDYFDGNGFFTEYYILTFADGSKITIKAEGKSTGSIKEKDPLFAAKVTVTGGTGIYQGSQGYGSMTGNRREELTSGTIVKLSFDITLK